MSPEPIHPHTNHAAFDSILRRLIDVEIGKLRGADRFYSFVADGSGGVKCIESGNDEDEVLKSIFLPKPGNWTFILNRGSNQIDYWLRS